MNAKRMAAIVQPVLDQVQREQKGKDWAGAVKCPVCGGVLRLSHSKYNGHVWGKCSTTGCVERRA